jgi:hypothetical protein
VVSFHTYSLILRSKNITEINKWTKNLLQEDEAEEKRKERLMSECSVVDVESSDVKDDTNQSEPDSRDDQDTHEVAPQHNVPEPEKPLEIEMVREVEKLEDQDCKGDVLPSSELDSSGTETASNLSALNNEEEPILVSCYNICRDAASVMTGTTCVKLGI